MLRLTNGGRKAEVRQKRSDGVHQHVRDVIHIVVKRLDVVLDDRRCVMGGTPCDAAAWVLEA
jgi:hypothetical protein